MAIHDSAWTICLCAALVAAPAEGHAQEGADDEGGGAEEHLPRSALPASDSPESPALRSHEPAALRARRRAQAFLLPLDEAARAAAGRVAQGATEAMLRSADEMIDLSLPLAAEGPQGAASLNLLVAGAAAEADRGESGPSLRRLAARFSLDRVLVGSVSLHGPSVAVLLTLADASRARLLGRESLLLPAGAAGAVAVEAQVEAAVRRLLDRAALDDAAPAPGRPGGTCPVARLHGSPGSGLPEAARPERASPEAARPERASLQASPEAANPQTDPPARAAASARAGETETTPGKEGCSTRPEQRGGTCQIPAKTRAYWPPAELVPRHQEPPRIWPVCPAWGSARLIPRRIR
jgi:hypothetical protein